MDDVTNFRHRVELNEILFRLSQDQDFIKQDDNLENIYNLKLYIAQIHQTKNSGIITQIYSRF